jgi:hypothetical protein
LFRFEMPAGTLQMDLRFAPDGGEVEPAVERIWDYQRYAAECLLLAEQTHDPATKSKLLAMAQVWTRLADLAEKNSYTDLVYETPARRMDHASRPVGTEFRIGPAGRRPDLRSGG